MAAKSRETKGTPALDISNVVAAFSEEQVERITGLSVRLEMNRVFSGSCEAAREELDAGEEDPGLGGLDGRLEVLGSVVYWSFDSKAPFNVI